MRTLNNDELDLLADLEAEELIASPDMLRTNAALRALYEGGYLHTEPLTGACKPGTLLCVPSGKGMGALRKAGR